ncbi:hypothetical protein [Puniceibacterium sediminis]|uniref:Predicted 5' DNA nuclease, flap endonuclease-1-like, helix-3-turn-helix (H3TH) domain n=1 Tax=Puniceibacterium sediminis TaxID=1608407 RepID=A0A238W7L1_9RHOB|nr:hypothetical protein [Puniceibacterium sediminis]SNR42556.1 Predicted 5' DNA nuclease, flap endonuclease-1-like, helix-3-turn-helix (H3TH) domain [Puniceibacterium sediminis]
MRIQNRDISCATGCLAVAGGIGFLFMVLLLVVGNVSWAGSIFLGLATTGAFGLLFSNLFCLPERSSAETQVAETQVNAPTVKSEPVVTTVSAVVPAGGKPGAEVKPSKVLAGQDELAARKGSWKYEGNAAAEPGEGAKPATLEAARNGKADDLSKIKGIGPKLQELCYSMGVYHFDQIAGWTATEVAWVDQNLEGFKGRVSRDEWVVQAKILAAGNETELSERTAKVDVY